MIHGHGQQCGDLAGGGERVRLGEGGEWEKSGNNCNSIKNNNLKKVTYLSFQLYQFILHVFLKSCI